MPTYTVVWRMGAVEADTPEEAAERVQEWMDRNTPWNFEVVETGSDLDLALDKLMMGAEPCGGEDHGH